MPGEDLRLRISLGIFFSARGFPLCIGPAMVPLVSCPGRGTTHQAEKKSQKKKKWANTPLHSHIIHSNITNMKSTIKKSPIALAVLCLLIEEPMHPYRMQQLIKERGKHEVINVRHRASIYQTIDRLLRDGAIAIKGRKQNEGKPDLTIYEITDEGRKAAYTWLREMLSTPKQEFLEFPAAVSFLMLLTPEDVVEELEKRANALEDTLARIDDQLQAVMEEGLPRLFLLETEYQRAMLVTELEWIRSIINDIQTKKIQWDEEWLRAIAKKFSKVENTENER